MSQPKNGDDVLYRTAAGVERSARVVRVVKLGKDPAQDDSICDLFVYGRPEDGPEFAAGPAYIDGVKREQRRHARDCKCKHPGAHVHTPGTWTA